MCWGFLCVHRESGAPFSREEVLFVQRISSHVGEGIRAGHLVASIETSPFGSEPGLVVLGPQGSVLSMTAAGERWLAELGHPDLGRSLVPAVTPPIPAVPATGPSRQAAGL